MLEAYLDESGIHEGAAVCIVAGFYARQSAWRRFERQWSTVIWRYPELKDHGFHAKVFFARDRGKRVGPYAHWSDEQAKAFQNHLVKIIQENWVIPIGYGVVVQDFLAFPLKIRQWLTGAKFTFEGEYVGLGCPEKSYYLPFQFCVLKAAQMSFASEQRKLHVFAGLDRTFSGYATELHKYLLVDSRIPAEERIKLGGISYPLSKDTPGIQAADFLTYRFYRHAQDLLKDRNTPDSPLVKQLTKRANKRHRFAILTSQTISLMVDTADEASRRILGV